MNLELLANIGTALSPYLVLGSIFYLALELRQQNKVSKAATRQEIAKAHQNLTLASMDERLISARIKFIKQEDLSEEEEHAWTVHLHAIFRARENTTFPNPLGDSIPSLEKYIESGDEKSILEFLEVFVEDYDKSLDS